VEKIKEAIRNRQEEERQAKSKNRVQPHLENAGNSQIIMPNNISGVDQSNPQSAFE